MFVDMMYMFIAAVKRLSKTEDAHTFEIKLGAVSNSIHLPADYNDNTKRLVVFGANFAQHAIPDNSVLVVFDCYDFMHSVYQRYSPHNIIYTYSQRDVQLAKADLEKKGMFDSRIYFFDCCYAPEHDGYISNTQKLFDACFYGGGSDRRFQVLHSIRSEGLRVHYGGNYDGQRRKDLLNSSKMMLAIYSGGAGFANSSCSRIFPAISNGTFVVAELSTDEQVNETLRPFCVLCTVEEMPSVVKYWSTHDEEREALRAQFHQRLKEYIPTKFDLSPIFSAQNGKTQLK